MTHHVPRGLLIHSATSRTLCSWWDITAGLAACLPDKPLMTANPMGNKRKWAAACPTLRRQREHRCIALFVRLIF